MEKVLTAEEFLIDEGYPGHAKHGLAKKWMIEFAKLHVEAALKHASEKAELSNKPEFSGDYNLVVDEESILNSYPLENIK